MMLAMVQAYSGNFPKHHPSVATPSKDVVMITGTTGGLGAVLLAELITSNDVIRVFAVNRKDPSGATLSHRQASALERQGLDPAIATSPKVTLLEADVSATDLGLPSDVLQPVCGKASIRALANDNDSRRSVHLSPISFTMVRRPALASKPLLTCGFQHGVSISTSRFSPLSCMLKECAT